MDPASGTSRPPAGRAGRRGFLFPSDSFGRTSGQGSGWRPWFGRRRWSTAALVRPGRSGAGRVNVSGRPVAVPTCWGCVVTRRVTRTVWCTGRRARARVRCWCVNSRPRAPRGARCGSERIVSSGPSPRDSSCWSVSPRPTRRTFSGRGGCGRSRLAGRRPGPCVACGTSRICSTVWRWRLLPGVRRTSDSGSAVRSRQHGGVRAGGAAWRGGVC